MRPRGRGGQGGKTCEHPEGKTFKKRGTEENDGNHLKVIMYKE
jgi:hypothetical protein